jgi:hypothetical protein
MRARYKAFPLDNLITMTASGSIDLAASKEALRSLAQSEAFETHYEVLLDMRSIRCTLSVTDLYEIASYMTTPDTALPARKRIAVLVSGPQALEHAHFLEVCATNRGVNVAAFMDHEKAREWLTG